MSNNDIEEYFGKRKIIKTFWLNDFSCIIYFNKGVVEFENEEIALEIFSKLTNFKYDETKSELENYDWRKSKKYQVLDNVLDLSLRISEENVLIILILGYCEKGPKKRIYILSISKKKK